MPGILSPLGEQYAFGYGRIGVLQQHLLTTQDIDRLLGAHNEEELRRILSEIRFTARVMPQEHLRDIVPAMERWLRDELEKMTPPDKREVFHILWLREDAPMIAYYLKKYHRFTSAVSVEPRAAVTGYDMHLVRALILEDRAAATLPRDLVAFIEQIKKDKVAPQRIDSAVAQYIALRQQSSARKSGSALVRRYTAHLVDLQNIRTARRLPEAERARFHFIEGGDIGVEALTKNLDALSALIRQSSLANVVAQSVEQGEESSVLLERGLNKGLAHDIAAMRGVPLSIEPLFSFAVIALSHIMVIRTVIIGKAAGLAAEDIKVMLPPFFSTSFAAA